MVWECLGLAVLFKPIITVHIIIFCRNYWGGGQNDRPLFASPPPQYFHLGGDCPPPPPVPRIDASVPCRVKR